MMYYTFNASHNHCTDPRFPGDGHPVTLYVHARSLIEAQREVKHFWADRYTVNLIPVGEPVASLAG